VIPGKQERSPAERCLPVARGQRKAHEPAWANAGKTGKEENMPRRLEEFYPDVLRVQLQNQRTKEQKIRSALVDLKGGKLKPDEFKALKKEYLAAR